MRFLLSVALIVGATGLLCHGIFTQEEAERARKVTAASDVERKWPYSEAAVKAREEQLKRLVDSPRTAQADEEFFDPAYAVGKIQSGFHDQMPWVDPYLASAIGIAGLLLAVLLPGARFRSLAMLIEIAGLLASAVSFLEPGRQAELARSFTFIQPVIHQFPRIAIGLMFLAGLMMGPRRRSRHDD
jgi:hypothetical protein